MIEYVKGDILTAQTEAIVNTVNTVGVMGKGIALRFKEAFPSNFKAYVQAVKNNQVRTGSMFVFPIGGANGVRYIINFPTKEDWFKPSQYKWIAAGLEDLVKVISQYQIRSIAIPPLGCGNGKLKWEKVRPMIEEALGQIPDVRVYVYEPDQKVQTLLAEEDRKDVALTPARAILLQLLFLYETNGEVACLFAANKLLYFMQRFGEQQLKLQFKRHHYGPYSAQVDNLVYRLQGSWLSGYVQKEAKPFDPLRLRYDRWNELEDYVGQLNVEERNRMKALTEFISGFESPLSLEVLATVDAILENAPQSSLEDVMRNVGEWNARKRDLIQAHHVEVAMERLIAYSGILYPA